ncbi:copper resistance CopC family protein [Corynebacterium sp. sy039]|uniref:copper resistance CopC family protein n=1 Tax=Corynebacterium sp. sy039 TaxID=2599641 RepID=UPI0011B3A747|nr:copper resistance CopC family protein [Corynebacterium sp. sy039]QDZ42711.1 copper resistance protein CopC [Corynebacterium sp. sy039]
MQKKHESIRHISGVLRVKPFMAALCSVVFMFLSVASLVNVPSAYAHDAVVGGSPANEEIVSEFPTTLRLDFSGTPREGFNTIALSDSNGKVIYSGAPVVSGQSIVLDLPADIEKGTGKYNIGFQITSSDGHATRGKTTFTVAGEQQRQENNSASSVPATTTQNSGPVSQTAQASAEKSGFPLGLVIGIAIAVVVGALVLFILLNRKKNN